MPLYEYECEACGQRFELIRKFSDPPLDACKSCGSGPVNRLPSSPAIQFKGSGWYITDYAKKGEGGKGEGGSKSDKTSTEQKQDAKSDAAANKGTTTEGKSEGAAKRDAPATSDAPAKTSGSSNTTSGVSKD